MENLTFTSSQYFENEGLKSPNKKDFDSMINETDQSTLISSNLSSQTKGFCLVNSSKRLNEFAISLLKSTSLMYSQNTKRLWINSSEKINNHVLKSEIQKLRKLKFGKIEIKT